VAERGAPDRANDDGPAAWGPDGCSEQAHNQRKAEAPGNHGRHDFRRSIVGRRGAQPMRSDRKLFPPSGLSWGRSAGFVSWPELV